MSDGRKISHDVLEAYRLSAITLYQQGVLVSVIAKSFGVGRQAVYKWIQKFERQGIKSLHAVVGSGRPPTLNASCFSELIALLKKPATEFGFTTALWSCARVGDLMRAQFKITYHEKHIPRLLRRLGLCMKFMERRALEKDTQALRWWKKERLPDILKWAKKQKALVFFTDESLIALPKRKPIARVSGRRGGSIGVISAVAQNGRALFELTADDENFTAQVFIRFIRKMKQEYPNRMIALIVDGAPAHTAKQVRLFREENKSWLRLEILPVYSPEPDPSILGDRCK